MTESTIEVARPTVQGDEISCRGRFTAASGHTLDAEFHFTAPSTHDVRARVRPFLLAFLVPAMRAGAALRLPLPVDVETHANLMEWQEAMASWHPSLKVVPIHADIASEAACDDATAGAISAFSGGVDSCFTAVRHTEGTSRSRYRGTVLQAGLMVHGFDVPLSQPDAFELTWRNSQAMLQAFGLRGYRLRTNVRDIEARLGLSWESQTHGIWLAAALSCLEPWFERVVIPSSYPYPVMKFPWGSNPATDPLFSSQRVPYWHDGSAYSKLGKLQQIATRQPVHERLRVCFEGTQLERNCGHCYKCIATQLCFWVSGVERPAAFPSPATLEEVAALPVVTPQNAYVVEGAWRAAREQGRTELATALGKAVRRGMVVRAVDPWRRKAANALRRMHRTAVRTGVPRTA